MENDNTRAYWDIALFFSVLLVGQSAMIAIYTFSIIVGSYVSMLLSVFAFGNTYITQYTYCVLNKRILGNVLNTLTIILCVTALVINSQKIWGAS